jgi:hypothetical protein
LPWHEWRTVSWRSPWSSPRRAWPGAPRASSLSDHIHNRWCSEGRGLEGGCSRAGDQRVTCLVCLDKEKNRVSLL